MPALRSDRLRLLGYSAPDPTKRLFLYFPKQCSNLTPPNDHDPGDTFHDLDHDRAAPLAFIDSLELAEDAALLGRDRDTRSQISLPVSMPGVILNVHERPLELFETAASVIEDIPARRLFSIVLRVL